MESKARGLFLMSLAAKPEAPEMKDAFESFMEQNLEKNYCASPPPAAWTMANRRSLAGYCTIPSPSSRSTCRCKKEPHQSLVGRGRFFAAHRWFAREREQGITIDVAYRYFETRAGNSSSRILQGMNSTRATWLPALPLRIWP